MNLCLKRPGLNFILLAFEIFIFIPRKNAISKRFTSSLKDEFIFYVIFLRWKNLFLMTLHVIDEDQCLIMLMTNVGNFYIIPQTGWYIILRCFHDARSDASPWFLIHIKRFLRDNKEPQAVFRIPTEKQFWLHLVLS